MYIILIRGYQKSKHTSSQNHVGIPHQYCGISGDPITDVLGVLIENEEQSIIEISQDLKDGLDEKLKSMKCFTSIHTSCRKKLHQTFNDISQKHEKRER